MTTDTAVYDFKRSMPLSPDQLWHLITDAAMRAQWAAPSEGMVLDVVAADLSVGGNERHRFGPADAPEFEVAARWYRIDAPSDAVFTETVEVGGEAIATSLVTYRVAETSTGSDLFVSVAVSSFVGAEASEEFQQGWAASLISLEKLAATQCP